jgi:dienelactone hydrolase
MRTSIAAFLFFLSASTLNAARIADIRIGSAPAFIVRPDATGAKVPVVIFIHWGLGDRHEFLSEANELAASGVASLLLDAPFVRADATPQPEHADIAQMVRETRAAIDYLGRQAGLDITRLGFVGHSYGAHIGGILVGSEPRIKAFVLMGGFPANSEKMDQADRAAVSAMAGLDAEMFVGKPHDAPVFHQYAIRDEFITRADADRYFDKTAGLKIVKFYEGGHEFNDASRRDRISWLASILGFRNRDRGYHAVDATEVPARSLGRYSEISKTGTVLEIPGMLEIPVRRDIAFKKDGAETLKMDVYYPFGVVPSDRIPAIILVSGQAGDQLMRNLRRVRFVTTSARMLATRANRVVIVYDTRSTMSGTAENQELGNFERVGKDLDDLVAYVRGHAGDLQIDGDSLGFFIRSAGSPYGLRAALRNAPPFVKAIGIHYPYPALTDEASLLKSGLDPALLDEVMPLRILARTKKSAPLLLVTGQYDFAYDAKEVAGFLEAAKNSGAGVTHIHLEHGDHGFDVVDDLEESRAALLETALFFRKQMPIRRSAP